MKKDHGGTREGAGRPEKSDKKTTYSTKLRPDQIVFLRSMGNAGAWLEETIDKHREKDAQDAQDGRVRATAIPAWRDLKASRIMEWVCTCGIKNSAPAGGATVACKDCRARVSTGNNGIQVTNDLKNRISNMAVGGAVYFQAGFGAGAWVADLLETKHGETCPWAVDMPKDKRLITPLESLY